jgi:isopenicillin-N epimerase
VNAFRDHWLLDPAVTFLNHGSYGACPRAVLDVQTEWRARMEREPVHFFTRELEPALDEVRAVVAAFARCYAEDLAFVPNATSGVSAVLGSLALSPGDELLTTNHAYNAVKNAIDRTAERAGARVVTVAMPFPCSGPDEVVERVVAAVSPRTRLAVLDHITSPTALVLPIARLVNELDARGIDTLVDGAHGPGQVDLDLRTLGAAYYTGNFHKWCCAPKGAALLYVRRDRRGSVRPLVTSHGANSTRRDRSRFQLEFDWTGTHDPSAVLSVPAALSFLGKLLPGGFEELRARNHALALAARRVLMSALSIAQPCPDEMIGSMAALPLPEAPPDERAAGSALYPDALQDSLVREHGLQVPIIPWPAPPQRLVRVSAQLYNELAEYEKLAALLKLSSRS